MKRENSEPQLLYIDDDGERGESYERVNQGGIGEREIGREGEKVRKFARELIVMILFILCVDEI